MMTPEKQPDLFTAGYYCVAGFVSKLENVPISTVITAAVMLIIALGTWGFTATHSYLQTLQANQIKIASDAKQDLKEWRTELKVDIDKIATANYAQDLCITAIQERQNGVIKLLDELKVAHPNGSKR